jgi:hypothetical protein
MPAALPPESYPPRPPASTPREATRYRVFDPTLPREPGWIALDAATQRFKNPSLSGTARIRRVTFEGREILEIRISW